jgi:hypothetical protein
VRPPDENQNGSTRPNFMSASRRAGGAEDNILARLERDARRTPSGKSWANQTRLAWCALAGLAVVGLIGTLALLAKENMAAHRQPLVIEAKASPPAPLAGPAAPPPMSYGGFAPLPSENVKMAAAAIDGPPQHMMAKSDALAHMPPMVMLKAVAAVSAKPAAAPPAARTTPAKVSSKSAPARTVVAMAPSRATVTAAPPARAAVAAAPVRARKTPPAIQARPEPAAVDSDIALLSAIIMHASRHAGERAQIEAAQCGAGKKCAPPGDLPAPLKTTD